MICALMIGRGGSTGFPGKNTSLVLGRPLCEYPLLAASQSNSVDEIFVSTDSPDIQAVGQKYGAHHIERPANLATSSALSDDVSVHGYGIIKQHVLSLGQELEMLVLLFANAATQSVPVVNPEPKLTVIVRLPLPVIVAFPVILH